MLFQGKYLKRKGKQGILTKSQTQSTNKRGEHKKTGKLSTRASEENNSSTEESKSYNSIKYNTSKTSESSLNLTNDIIISTLKSEINEFHLKYRNLEKMKENRNNQFVENNSLEEDLKSERDILENEHSKLLEDYESKIRDIYIYQEKQNTQYVTEIAKLEQTFNVFIHNFEEYKNIYKERENKQVMIVENKLRKLSDLEEQILRDISSRKSAPRLLDANLNIPNIIGLNEGISVEIRAHIGSNYLQDMIPTSANIFISILNLFGKLVLNYFTQF